MRLKEIRLEKGLSQWEVANGIKTGQSNIGRWENGDVLPSADFIIKLADFFGVSTDYLLGRTDDFGYVTVQNSPTVPELSRDEKKLLDNFRAMRPDLQAVCLNMSKTLLQTPNSITEKTPNDRRDK